MNERRTLQLAVFFAGLALAYPSPTTALRVVFVALPLAALIVGPRLALGRVGQAVGAIAAMGLGLVLARVSSVEVDFERADQLSQRTLLLGAPMLAIAAFRAVLERPVYGERLTLTAALVALTAAGRAQTGWVFPVLAGAALVSGMFALRAHDPTRAPLRRTPARAYAAIAFAGVLSAGLMTGAAALLPSLQQALIARLQWRTARTAFSESMMLGSMSGMLQSERVVLRLRNQTGHAPPELLRGAVYSRYVSKTGRWEPAPGLGGIEVVETEARPPDPAGFVELEHAGRPEHYFLPLEAREVFASEGFFDRERTGVLRPSTGATSKRLWFKSGEAPSAPSPSPVDLEVPSRVRPDLEAVLAAWGVRSDQPPEERLRLIERRLLADYHYSVDYRRGRGDAIVDFLTVHREGHCEYFAAAFVLLARTAGVPAHVAAGYRVTEASPLGYYIVRERNAHAWAEAWIGERWSTWDPTPAGDLAAASRAETGAFAALLDGVRTAWEAVDDFLAKRTAFEFGLALLVLVGGLFLVRALRGKEAKAAPEVADVVPEPLARFLAALAERGIDRHRAETLASLGRRVIKLERIPPGGLRSPGTAALDEALRADVLAALEEVERLRYGAVGDASAVFARLDRLVARLAAR